MVAPSRAAALLLVGLGLALAACGGKPGPDDPAVAVSTGIPVGATSASGVAFDAPVAIVEPPPRSAGGKLNDPPKPLPLDPFDPSPAPPPTKITKKKGTSL
ncbi:MAG: hypothetical protein ABJE95_14000 [Byssovorax sp.]